MWKLWSYGPGIPMPLIATLELPPSDAPNTARRVGPEFARKPGWTFDIREDAVEGMERWISRNTRPVKARTLRSGLEPQSTAANEISDSRVARSSLDAVRFHPTQKYTTRYSRGERVSIPHRHLAGQLGRTPSQIARRTFSPSQINRRLQRGRSTAAPAMH
jgi:hypothetical protein